MLGRYSILSFILSNSRSIGVTLIGILFWSPTFAQELRPFYRGVRALGMGGCYAATVNDETALLLNPAALGKLRDFYGTLLDPELDISKNTYSMYTQRSFSQYFNLDSIKERLDANRTIPYHARAQAFPSIVGHNFGVGIYTGTTLDATMDTTGATIDANYRNDAAFLLGYNFRFLDGRIKLGFGAKLINRIEYASATIPVDLVNAIDVSSYQKEGTAVGVDAGLIMTAPWMYLPTLAAVVHDVGNTKFDKASGLRLSTTTQPDEIKQDMDVAIAIYPIHTNRLRSTWTLQYSNVLTAQTETDKTKLYHAGMEFNFSDLLFFRAGYNQRYWTAGIELASEHFQIQTALYGEEIGTATAPVEDRRYVLKLAFRY